MTFGSLFAGIGGFDLGLERAGFECRWQVENDPFCQKVLARHWPEVKRYGDIRTICGTDLEPVDLICGGFPCQDLSHAGKRAGIEADRSGLWFEFARLVHELGPRYVLAENVPGLLVRGAMDRVVGELARLGYVGIWRSLRAADFGAAHLRKRVFIVAYRNSVVAGREPGIMGTPQRKEQSERLQRQWDGDAARYGGDDVAYAECPRWPTAGVGRYFDAGPEPETGSRELANGFSPRLEERRRFRGDDAEECAAAERDCGTLPVFAPGPADSQWPTILRERPDLAPTLESALRRVADGPSSDLDGAMRDRTKRLGRLGNAVIPQIAEWIGLRILQAERGGL